jgi:polyferredoxin
MRKVHIFLLIVLLSMMFLMSLFIYAIWTVHFKISDNEIPTVLNGIASSIALCVGFIVAAIAFLSRNGKTTRKKKTQYIEDIFPFAIIVFLGFPITLLFGGYYTLLANAAYHEAAKDLLTGLTLSFFLLFSTIVYAVAKASIE